MKKTPSATSSKQRTEQSNVLPLQGEIDFHVSSNVSASLQKLIANKPPRVVVDFSGVTYIDSSGLAALIDSMQRVQEYGGQFALAGLHQNVRTIFEIAKLDQVFRIFPNTDIALSA